MERGGYVYIMCNQNNTTLYIGVTSNLYNQISEHKDKIYPKSFTSKYNIDKLVYYFAFTSIEEAITEEKRLKAGSRSKKVKLIEAKNPNWVDLYNEIELW